MKVRKEIIRRHLLYLRLPNDQNLRKQLEAKLEEYRGRINEPSMYDDSLAKSELLAVLLMSGIIDTWKYWKDFRKIHPNLDPYHFLNACVVINAYTNYLETSLWGGTDLPKIQS